MEQKDQPIAIDVQKIIGTQLPEVTSSFQTKEAILYALGIGFSRDPYNQDELMFTYELHKKFRIFPTFACVFAKMDLLEFVASLNLPKFNPMMLLHGEQRVEIFKDLRPNQEYLTNGSVLNITDKTKGMLLTLEVNSYELGKEERILSVRQIISLFIRGQGGFKYKGKSLYELPQKPKREPDIIFEDSTFLNQAILYRLNGDFNPLHIDPEESIKGGFKIPILHGMCFYGIACKVICQHVLRNECQFMKALQARFLSHVFPGDKIKFSIWKEANDKIIFSGSTVERGLECILGIMELKERPKLS